MKKSEKNELIDCDHCEKEKATKNIQRMWTIYDIDDKGHYSDGSIDPNCEPSESHHLCDECFRKWDEGEISF